MPKDNANRVRMSSYLLDTALGAQPQTASADNGYWSEAQVEDPRVRGIDLHIATGRQKHGEGTESEKNELPLDAAPQTARERMRQKLKTEAGQDVYRRRKAIVEPVFGQIKHWRGFRRFLLRGLSKVQAEWKLICLTHNLLKLFRSQRTALQMS